MRVTHYTVEIRDILQSMSIALVPDIHNNPHDKIIECLEELKPDIIAVAGDLMQSIGSDEDYKTKKKNERGFEFLRKASGISPVFYSLGNHEAGITPENRQKVISTGAVLLDNTYTFYKNFVIGGLSSSSKRGHIGTTPKPSLEWLDGFEKENGAKILLCHHPEYYPEYLKDRNIDVILSGHAHGGQWRIFGKGIYAPGQGLFPKLTSGVRDGRLVISRGLGSHNAVPRLFNEPETVMIKLVKKD